MTAAVVKAISAGTDVQSAIWKSDQPWVSVHSVSQQTIPRGSPGHRTAADVHHGTAHTVAEVPCSLLPADGHTFDFARATPAVLACSV